MATQTAEAVEQLTKYAKENPVVVGGASVFALLTTAFVWRKSQLKRDG